MKLLDYIMKTRNASDESDVENLLSICNTPSLDDKVVMGNLYEEALGYNPITAFDEEAVGSAFDAIYEVAPATIQEQMDEKRSEIIEQSLKCLSAIDKDLIGNITAQAVKVETGWIDPDMEYQIPLAIIRFLSNEEDGFEIDPDDLGPDETSEDEDDEDDDTTEEDDDLNLELAEMLGEDDLD